MGVDSDWTTTLTMTGYLTQEQLQRWYPMIARPLRLEPWMLWYQDALWDKRRFTGGQKQAHWLLRTEIYLSLLPILEEWCLEPQAGIVRPDALLRVQGIAGEIALEVDTGKETRAQWLEKLHRYSAADPAWRVLVVARGGQVRLTRLTSWLETSSPRAWSVWPADSLPSRPRFHFENPVVGLPPKRALARPIQYMLKTRPLPQEAAEAGLKEGTLHIQHQERHHGADIIFLAWSRKRGPSPSDEDPLL